MSLKCQHIRQRCLATTFFNDHGHTFIYVMLRMPIFLSSVWPSFANTSKYNTHCFACNFAITSWMVSYAAAYLMPNISWPLTGIIICFRFKWAQCFHRSMNWATCDLWSIFNEYGRYGIKGPTSKSQISDGIIENRRIVTISNKSPTSSICLLNALRYWGIK